MNAEFVGEAATTEITSVKDAVALKDDSRVIVDEDFRNIKITADDKVRITAEVDSDLATKNLDAEYLELADFLTR